MGCLSSLNQISFDNMKKAMCWGTVMAYYCVENFGTKHIIDLNQREYNTRFDNYFKKMLTE